MPALIPTDFKGTVTWLGLVGEEREGVRSAAKPEMFASFAGAEGEIHSGLTRPSCVRVTTQYPEGTEIANVRQFTIVSAEELSAIAEKMEIDEVKPEWLGASIVVEGIPDFTHVPPSARLQNEAGTCLVIEGLTAEGLFRLPEPASYLTRGLVFCGVLSYSLYIWHWPVITFLRWTVGFDQPWAST